MHDLERCPICGSENVNYSFRYDAIDISSPPTLCLLHYIVCNNCRSKFVVRTNDKEQLIKSFNRRSGGNRLTCFSCGSPLLVKSMSLYSFHCSFHLVCNADQNSSLDACGLEYWVSIPNLRHSPDAHNKDAQELFELYLDDEPSAKWVEVNVWSGREEKKRWGCSNCMTPAPSIGYLAGQELTAYCPGCKLRMRVDKDDSEGGGDGEGG